MDLKRERTLYTLLPTLLFWGTYGETLRDLREVIVGKMGIRRFLTYIGEVRGEGNGSARRAVGYLWCGEERL